MALTPPLRFRLSLAVLPLLILATVQPVSGQTGLLVVAHGGSATWNQQVRNTVQEVEWTRGPVEIAFLMGPESDSAGWKPAVESLVARRAQRIIAVPLMVSSFGGHFDQIMFYAGRRKTLAPALATHDHVGDWKPPVPIEVTSALDDAPELGATLYDRWQALTPRDQNRPLYLIAHGPGADSASARWISNIRSAADTLARIGHPAKIGLLQDDASPAERAQAIARLRANISSLSVAAGDSVLVLSVLISSGRIDQVTIPTDLAELPVHYVPTALTPSHHIARWIERQAHEAMIHHTAK